MLDMPSAVQVKEGELILPFPPYIKTKFTKINTQMISVLQHRRNRVMLCMILSRELASVNEDSRYLIEITSKPTL